MSSPSPTYKLANIPALDDVDLDAAETADTFPTSTSPPGLTGLGLKVTKGRARAGSVSANAAAAAASTDAPSAASKVRAAAAMWETKDPVTTATTGTASNGGTRPPGRKQQSAASSTSPRSATAARFQGAAATAASGGAAGTSASSSRSSPRSPLTTPKLASPSLSSWPRSPPTAFKGMGSSGVKPLRLGRSTSSSSVSSAGSSRGRSSPAAPALNESPKSPAKSIEEEEFSKVDLHDDDDLDELHDEPLHDEPLHDEPLHDEPVAAAAAKIASPERAPKIPSPEAHTSHIADEDESAPLDFGRAAPSASPEPTPSSLVTPASPNGSHSNYSASPVPSHRDLEPSSSDALHAHTTLSPQVERVGLSSDPSRFDLSPASVYEDFSPVSAKTDLLPDGGKVDLLPTSEKIDVSPLSSSALEFQTGVEQEAHHETVRDFTHEHVEAESELLDNVDLSPPPAPPSKLALSRPTTPDHGQLSPSLETPRAYGGGPTATITPASPVGPGTNANTSDDHITTPTTPPTTGGLVANDFEEVRLSPAKHDPPSATSTPVRSMSSLFSRVLDYTTPPPLPKDKEVAPVEAAPTTPGEEKDLPAPKDLPPKDDVSKEASNKDSGSSFSASRSRFFTSATSAFGSFNLPSVSLPSMPTLPRGNSTHSDTSPPSELAVPSPAALLPGPIGSAATSPGSASTWRSTMTNFLATRAGGITTTSPASSPISKPSLPPRTSSANATVAAAAATAVAGTTVTAASLLLHRLDSPTSARDRRHSREVGGSDKLREGFERVRGEMEGAARDIRRQRARGSEIDIVNVDWVFWGAVVQDYEEIARTQPKELSRAIQQGIPPVIRGPIWQLMSSSKSAELEETYKALLKLHSQHEKAIRKDITRTFPTHKFFQHTGQGQDGLFMVVKAYSLYDQEVGYTQGIAFIVAALLLNMPDEEAFCVLVRLMDSYNLRSHYLADMPGLQLRLYQFDRLLEECLPLLSNHLVRKGVKSSMYASQWFMTLFSYRFPLSLVYRVLDIVLAEGIEAIFRFSLALLRKSEDQLLELGFEDILNYLQGDLFEVYRAESGEGDAIEGSREGEEEWRTNDFVRDAYEVHITPLMLDQYEAEWNEKCREQMAHAREMDQLRSANRHLSAQVKTLESSLATMNNEHVELVRQLVLAKIAREDMETELVKYKSLCASLSQSVHGDIDGALASNPSGLSLASLRSAAATASVASNHSSPAMGHHHETGNLVPSLTGQSAASVSSTNGGSPGGPSV